MLINLSNHRVQDWSQPQLETAKEKYGSIYDIEFTNLNDWNERTRYMEIEHPQNNNEFKKRKVLPIPDEVKLNLLN